jgi:uncharacterized protein YbjT (DUF2867 family)
MQKRILILGATGRTGQITVELALAKGYAVTALVRNPDKIKFKSDSLEVMKGLPTNIEDVRQAMKGCNVVISLLSALSDKESFSIKKISPPHTLKKSIGNALQVMREYGVKRILTLSSIGAGNSFEYAPWFMKVIIKLTNFKIVFADHNAQESLIQNSGLDWTIARPVGLNENENIGELVVNYSKTPKPFKMSRKQLAKFFIDNVDSETFSGKIPMLSEI